MKTLRRRTHLSQLVWGALVLTATLLAAQAEEPQGEARRLAQELVVATGARELRTQVLQQLVAQLQQSGLELSPEFFEALKAELYAQDVSELVVPVYVEHLSVEEMQAPDRQGLELTWRTTRGTRAESSASQVFMALPYEEVVKILVPDYLATVPKEDGWGHPYQFAINDDLASSSVGSFRSPGRDGAFQGEVYEAGTFPLVEYDRDIVWCNGYLVTRPQAE
jgi:hypothetical protein